MIKVADDIVGFKFFPFIIHNNITFLGSFTYSSGNDTHSKIIMYGGNMLQFTSQFVSIPAFLYILGLNILRKYHRIRSTFPIPLIHKLLPLLLNVYLLERGMLAVFPSFVSCITTENSTLISNIKDVLLMS